VLDVVQGIKRGSWMVVYTSTPRAFEGDVLTLTFASDNDVQSFRQQAAGESVSEHLRQAILQVLGVRVKFIARVDGAAATATAPAKATPTSSSEPGAAPASAPAATGWNVTPIANAPAASDDVPPPDDADAPPADDEAPEPDEAPAPSSNRGRMTAPPASERPAKAKPAGRPGAYGEAVVREVLKASFIEEVSLAPTDRQVRLVEEPGQAVPGSEA
jgi:DNA polymerase-3 subunit gamma/tau